MTAPDRRRCLLQLGGLGLLAATGPGQAQHRLQWEVVKAGIRSRYPAVAQISVPALQDWLRDTTRLRPLLLDTRTAAEFADGHLEAARHADAVGSAMLQLRQRAPGGVAVLYCSVGYRSSALAAALLARGAQRIFNLEGSLFEWANQGLPVVAADGRPGKVHPYDRWWGALLRRDLWSREP